jgi:NAD(P)-dependent dehydrogenase (short-subunit alcohol dehydrogenase family)
MNELLSERTVVVTGAAHGIGQATAIALARAGANLVLVDRDRDGAEGTADQVRAIGSEAIAVQADVSVEDDVARMVQATIAKFGRLDGAFNNAGVVQRNKPLHELSYEDWEYVQSVNLRGVFLCLKYEVRAMLNGRGGSIVNTASALGRVGLTNAAEYCASKGGVLGLTKGAALDYGTMNIRVNAILPGVIRTPMVTQPSMEELLPLLEARHPIGRLGEPHEVADTVVWLLSNRSSFVTASEISVDGGYIAI